MAKEILNPQILENFTEYPNMYKRQAAFPIDTFSLFGTKEQALAYATDPDSVAYVGQIITVASDPNPSLNGTYRIEDTKGTLSKFGISGKVEDVPEATLSSFGSVKLSPKELNGDANDVVTASTLSTLVSSLDATFETGKSENQTKFVTGLTQVDGKITEVISSALTEDDIPTLPTSKIQVTKDQTLDAKLTAIDDALAGGIHYVGIHTTQEAIEGDLSTAWAAVMTALYKSNNPKQGDVVIWKYKTAAAPDVDKSEEYICNVDKSKTFSDWELLGDTAAGDQKLGELETAINGEISRAKNVESTLSNALSTITDDGKDVKTYVDAAVKVVNDDLTTFKTDTFNTFKSSVETSAANLCAEITATNGTVTSIDSRVDKLEADLTGFTSEAYNTWKSTVDQSITSLNSTTGQHTTDIQAINTAIGDFTYANLTTWQEKVETTSANLCAEIGATNEIVASHTSVLDGLGSNKGAVKTYVDEQVRQTNETVTNISNDIYTEKTGLSAKFTALSNEIHTPGSGLSAKFTSLSNEIHTPGSGLSAQVTTNTSAISTANSNIEKNKQAIATNEQNISKANSAIAANKTKIGEFTEANVPAHVTAKVDAAKTDLTKQINTKQDALSADEYILFTDNGDGNKIGINIKPDKIEKESGSITKGSVKLVTAGAVADKLTPITEIVGQHTISISNLEANKQNKLNITDKNLSWNSDTSILSVNLATRIDTKDDKTIPSAGAVHGFVTAEIGKVTENLAKALIFEGVATSKPSPIWTKTDTPAATAPSAEPVNPKGGFKTGSVVIYGNKEYVWVYGENKSTGYWYELGDEAIWATKETVNAIDKRVTQNTAAIAAINSTLSSMDVKDTVVSKQFVTAVEQKDGKITVSRAELAASDIPNIAESQVTDLTTHLDNKVEISAYNNKVAELQSAINNRILSSEVVTLSGELNNAITALDADTVKSVKLGELTAVSADSTGLVTIPKLTATADVSAVFNTQVIPQNRIQGLQNEYVKIDNLVLDGGSAFEITPVEHIEYDTVQTESGPKAIITGVDTSLENVVVPNRINGMPVIEVRNGSK